MKKILLISSLNLFFTSLAFASGFDNIELAAPQPSSYAANNGFYIGIHGGAAFPSELFDPGFDVGVQLGYRFTPHFRMEGAFSYLRNNIFGIALNSYLGMTNAFYDFQLTPLFNPFVGVGIGVNDFSAIGMFSGPEFAYQAIAGLGFNISQNMMLSFRYRFIGIPNELNYNIAEANLDYFF